MLESRKNIRVGINIKYKGFLKDDCVIEGKLDDISASGLGFWSENKLDMNEEIKMEFKIEKKTICVDGTIIFGYEEKEDRFRYGIKFTNLNEQNSNLINRYIKKEIVLFLAQSEI